MTDYLSHAQSFFGPNVFGTLVSAGFGAFAGAWVASRRETKRSVTTELNSINAARALCFSICNKFLNLKGQHILNLHREYNMDREKVIATDGAARAGVAVTPIDVRLDMQTLTPIWLPTQTLERLIFEKISIRGRALVAAVEVVSCIDALEKSIAYRNALVAEFQDQSGLAERQRMDRHFGLPSPTGAVDERFASNITALYNQIDDCIFFSRVLADDLFQYGSVLRKRFAWRYRLGAPKPVPDDWTIAEQNGLLPANGKYANWLRAFRTPPTRAQRLRKWLHSFWPASSGA
jgi:hypothetical protein